MRIALFAAVVFAPAVWVPVAAQPTTKTGVKGAPAGATADTRAAELTRTKLLKVKITVEFKGVPLREAMKEFAAQVDMMEERPVLWTYADGVPADQPITYTCSDKPLEKVLDEVFKKHKLGYVVISVDDHPRDGWVRITKGNERGFGKDPDPAPTPPPADDDETKAAARLKLAKGLIDQGKPADAKAVLTLVVTKYPKTKAATEAKELLEKLTK
ncbi:MAG: hypothetical protein JWO38_1953 [Gemmataceae bacterium]|nr:hypothetical protein [Gemmataceae bacterium]